MLIRITLTVLLGISPVFGLIAMAETPHKAVIGISGSAADSKSVTSMMVMVRSLGAEPVLLSNHAQRASLAGGMDQAIAEDAAMVDAVIVMGNNGDIDPAKYGEAAHAKTNIEEDHARAQYEEGLIKTAMEKKIPLLGICGGHQRINVLAGGSLHQHVPDLVGDEHHMQGDIPGYIPVQYVGITEGTKLDEITDSISGVYTPTHEKLPDNVIMENSFHHQAIKAVGTGLRINAVSNDNVIEGIEADPNGPYKDQFLMGVQWHPEFGASEVGPKLVTQVIEESKAYRLEHPRTEVFEPSRSFIETMESSLNTIKQPLNQPANSTLNPGNGSMVDFILRQREQAAGRGMAP